MQPRAFKGGGGGVSGIAHDKAHSTAAGGGGLKPSRSYLTLADLEHTNDSTVGNHGEGDMHNNLGPQQVTLVQGEQQDKAQAAAPNPFVDVFPRNVKTKVISLTSPRTGGGVYNTNHSNRNRNGDSISTSSMTPRSRRRWRKRQAAFLSFLVLLIAVFYRRDPTQDFATSLHSKSQQADSVSHPPGILHSGWTYMNAMESLVASSRRVGEAIFGGSNSATKKMQKEHAVFEHSNALELTYARWNATRSTAPLLTEWGEQLHPNDVTSHEHHPRPQMERPGKWMNLNGFWDYKTESMSTSSSSSSSSFPSREGFEGKILVPFSIESALSGVGKCLGSEQKLVYRRFVKLDPRSEGEKEERHILHFGAVDWKAWVYVNGHLVGTHEGGYDAFHFDITDHISSFSPRVSSGSGGGGGGGSQEEASEGEGGRVFELTVVAWDPTEDGLQPHGKQWMNKESDRLIAPAGMWYTSVTGIWQTVWLETVPEVFHIENMKITPSIKSSSISAEITTVSTRPDLMPYVKMTAYDENGIVGFGSGWSGNKITLKFNSNHIPKLWHPDSPFLYDLTVSLHLSASGEPVDEIKSYFAMREISLGRSGDAVQFFLNGKPEFQYGVLDQGWWPDGLYTPPSEDALEFDIVKAKEFGFNLIRKHAKVESDRFYHLCDKLGMLVWQDMPSASGIYMWSPDGAHDYREGEKSPESASSFMAELQGVMESLYNHPSVVAWIPFNEGWGQFSTEDIFSWMESYDPQRLVWVSGGNDFGIGSAFDRHVYPGPSHVRQEQCRASVLGEFGGNGFAIEGHIWSNKQRGDGVESSDYETFVDWGYAQVKSLSELGGVYKRQMRALGDLVNQGLSSAIFTQLSDVEGEFNGLMTYDRKVLKLSPSEMKQYHDELYRSGSLPKETGRDRRQMDGNINENNTEGNYPLCAWELPQQT